MYSNKYLKKKRREREREIERERDLLPWPEERKLKRVEG